MEGEERRKRKIENEEENEEQKMEKFFALIKRTKDVRDRFYKEKLTDTKKIDGEKAAAGGTSTIWNPKFQPEDFIDSGEMAKKNNIINIVSGHDHAAAPSEKELIIEKKQDLQEATTATPAAAQDNEEKDKASEHFLDLDLTL